MKTIRIAAIAAAASFSAATETLEAQTTKWNLDPAHSQVKFSVTHMLISEVDGTFKKFEAAITTEGEDFSKSSAEFTLDVASISTENEMRDAHLKGDEFFNAVKFPKIKFVSTSLKKMNETDYSLTGQLTIREVTKTVTFKVTKSETVIDPWGNTRIAFKVTGAINRMDYNLKWNMLLESGGAVVSETVNFASTIELTKQK